MGIIKYSKTQWVTSRSSRTKHTQRDTRPNSAEEDRERLTAMLVRDLLSTTRTSTTPRSTDLSFAALIGEFSAPLSTQPSRAITQSSVLIPRSSGNTASTVVLPTTPLPTVLASLPPG